MSSNQILLGIKDDMIAQTDNTCWKISKIGGKPDLIPNCALVDNIPQCQLCEKKMALAVQVYCPLGTSPYDRTLYVFCCINQECWNKQESWQAYRVQHLPNEQNIKEEVSHTEESWLSEELDWDDDSNSNTPDTIMNPDIRGCDIVIEQSISSDDTECTSIADDCSPLTMKSLDMNRATTENLPWQTSRTLLVAPDYSPLFKSFFISVIEEPPAEKINSDGHVQQLLDSYQGMEFHIESQNTNIASGAEIYEKYCLKHGDRTFQKFANRVARCQEQVIRYSWKGEPLLMRKETLPLTCQYCHGPVTYELQLMPALVNFLRLQDIKSEDVAVEFGTVLIFTCQNSCWEEDSKFRIENVCVQSDPDENLFQQRI